MAMSNGDEVGAIAPSHLPIMEFFGNRCRNALTPTPPSMALVYHANCRTFRTGVSRWFYQFLSEGLTMWPAGHTFKPRLGCFGSRGCVSIKTQSASGFGLRQLLRPLPVGTARRPHRRAQL